MIGEKATTKLETCELVGAVKMLPHGSSACEEVDRKTVAQGIITIFLEHRKVVRLPGNIAWRGYLWQVAKGCRTWPAILLLDTFTSS